MRSWTPQAIYDAKTWVLTCVWSVWRGLLCFAGAGLAIAGGATLQMRQDYRAKSKWRRDGPS